MAHQEHGSFVTSIVDSLQDACFVQAIKVRGRFIQEHEGRIAKEHACKPNALAFATREGIAQFAHRSLKAFGKARKELGECRFFAGCFEFLLGCMRLGDQDVLCERASEEVRVLCKVAFVSTQALRLDLADVKIRYLDHAARSVPEAKEQLAECRFA